jgi:hypothetical protein
MPDYIFLMHDDSVADEPAWEPYLRKLRQSGAFQGGSAIGAGVCARKAGTAPAITAYLAGFIRVHASDLAAARSLLSGNPVYEAGGTVEIRELPISDQ